MGSVLLYPTAGFDYHTQPTIGPQQLHAANIPVSCHTLASLDGGPTGRKYTVGSACLRRMCLRQHPVPLGPASSSYQSMLHPLNSETGRWSIRIQATCYSPEFTPLSLPSNSGMDCNPTARSDFSPVDTHSVRSGYLTHLRCRVWYKSFLKRGGSHWMSSSGLVWHKQNLRSTVAHFVLYSWEDAPRQESSFAGDSTKVAHRETQNRSQHRLLAEFDSSDFVETRRFWHEFAAESRRET